jgi:hypothetical protein
MGVEMLLDSHDRVPPHWYQIDIPTSVSLLVVAGILFASIVLSITATQRDERRGKGNPKADENPKSEGGK